VDFTIAPPEIAAELARINNHPYLKRAQEPDHSFGAHTSPDGIRRILRLLRTSTSVDFELYKPAMLARRIARRMALHKLDTPEKYLQLLQADGSELNALYQDIFIHVTGFFRDPESLDVLKQHVFSKFTSGKGRPAPAIRVWVPGCSTGEEAYSIGMLLFEAFAEHRAEPSMQIFGTDISERMDGGFQVAKSLRDVCVFARHDLSRDAPFSKMDLISCRNVLIYMVPELQKKIIQTFHYALKPGGYLLMGKSESLGVYSGLFDVEDSKHKVLVRRPFAAATHLNHEISERVEKQTISALRAPSPSASDLRREAELLLLEQYSPAALVIDSNLQILHFQGNTGPFLSPASGEASFHLLRMIRPELLVDVRTAIQQAKSKGVAVRKEAVRVTYKGDSALVDIDVSPLKAQRPKEFDYLVVFRERNTPPPHSAKGLAKETPGQTKDRTKAELARKERELASLSSQFRAMVQDHEAAKEEMRSMNEEMLSSNEELQSTNEELETAKEELESSNEELTTLNDELQKRNTELSQLTNDLSNLLTGVDIPILILDAELRIRRFTPVAGEVLHLITTDLGRPLSDIASTLDVSWAELSSLVISKGQTIEREVRDRQGKWYTLRMRPYRSGTDTIDGLLITLLDIDAVKRSAQEISESRRRSDELAAQLALAGEGLGVGIWEFDLESDEVHGTARWCALNGLPPDTVMSRAEWIGKVHPEDRDMIAGDLKQLVHGRNLTHREYRVIWQDGSFHWLDRRAELIAAEGGTPARVRGISISIDDRKAAEQERQMLASRIASAQEEERQRIARELHDGLIQDLAGLAIDISQRAANAASSDASLEQDLRSFQSRVAKYAAAARHVAYRLHASELDDLGLEAALRAFCEDFGNRAGIAIKFKKAGSPLLATREAASCIYSIAQEALRNVAKHSHAKRAVVSLEATARQISLCIEDKGAGFPMPSLKTSAGLGVVSMRERARLVNGNFSVTSKPSRGTRVLVEIPIPEVHS
jgi:two-component system CheB/CheR fusion protein